MLLAPMDRAQMDANHLKRRRALAPARAPSHRIRNVGPVLDLGNTVFFTFRGRAFGVPPVPYQVGRAISAIWTEAVALGAVISEDKTPRYYELIASLPPLIWANSYPVGRWRRLRRRLGLFRNPFRKATEAELVDLAGFFRSRRMTSGVQFPPAAGTTSKTA